MHTTQSRCRTQRKSRNAWIRDRDRMRSYYNEITDFKMRERFELERSPPLHCVFGDHPVDVVPYVDSCSDINLSSLYFDPLLSSIANFDEVEVDATEIQIQLIDLELNLDDPERFLDLVPDDLLGILKKFSIFDEHKMCNEFFLYVQYCLGFGPFLPFMPSKPYWEDRVRRFYTGELRNVGHGVVVPPPEVLVPQVELFLVTPPPNQVSDGVAEGVEHPSYHYDFEFDGAPATGHYYLPFKYRPSYPIPRGYIRHSVKYIFTIPRKYYLLKERVRSCGYSALILCSRRLLAHAYSYDPGIILLHLPPRCVVNKFLFPSGQCYHTYRSILLSAMYSGRIILYRGIDLLDIIPTE